MLTIKIHIEQYLSVFHIHIFLPAQKENSELFPTLLSKNKLLGTPLNKTWGVLNIIKHNSKYLYYRYKAKDNVNNKYLLQLLKRLNKLIKNYTAKSEKPIKTEIIWSNFKQLWKD